MQPLFLVLQTWLFRWRSFGWWLFEAHHGPSSRSQERGNERRRNSQQLSAAAWLEDKMPSLGWVWRGWDPRSWETRLSSDSLHQIPLSYTLHSDSLSMILWNRPASMMTQEYFSPSSLPVFIWKAQMPKTDSELKLCSLEQIPGLLKSEDRSALTLKSLSMDSFREMF